MADQRPDRVVLVDPSGTLETRFGVALEDADFVVTAVDSAAECLRSVEEGLVDAVVSEFELPDLDGLRLLRSIRVTAPGLPFVLAPRDGSERLADEAMTATATGYVPAHASASTLISQLRDGSNDRAWLDAETDQRYRHLIEISPAPINLFDAAGESIWCNEAVVDLLGLDSRSDLIGKSIFEFIHPEDRELAHEELEEVIEHKEPVGPTRMRLKRLDGEVRHVMVSTAIGRFLDSDIGQAIVIDVTPIQEAERALLTEREFIKSALDTLQDVFYVITPDGEIIGTNAAAADVTGFDEDTLIGMHVGEIFAADDLDRVESSIETVLQEGDDTVEADVVTTDGRSIAHEFRGRRFRTEAGEPRIVGIGRDISEQKERMRQLRVFESWLRHNIRNDMNVVQLLAEKILEGRAEDIGDVARRIQAYAGHIVHQANRERDLVEMLTDPPTPTRQEISDRVERAVEESRRQYPHATIGLDAAEVGTTMVIPGFEDAVGELISNAVEHNGSDAPRVDVKVDSRTDGSVIIRIADDGPGIPQEERELLFLDREIDKLHHGSGLGLLFVYWVVRVSGGTIDIADNDPKGTVVTITLPPE